MIEGESKCHYKEEEGKGEGGVGGEYGDKCCYLLQHVRCHVNRKSERHFYGAGKAQIQKKITF